MISRRGVKGIFRAAFTAARRCRLSIATRPDCQTDDVVENLADLNQMFKSKLQLTATYGEGDSLQSYVSAMEWRAFNSRTALDCFV